MDHILCRQIGGVLSVVLALTSSAARAATPDDEALLKQAQALFKTLPKDMGTTDYPITPERVTLGRFLYFDPRISLDGTVSCSKCHQPYLYGTDALAKPIGVKDRQNPRNAPTVLNAALQLAAHWRGDRVVRSLHLSHRKAASEAAFFVGAEVYDVSR